MSTSCTSSLIWVITCQHSKKDKAVENGWTHDYCARVLIGVEFFSRIDALLILKNHFRTFAWDTVWKKLDAHLVQKLAKFRHRLTVKKPSIHAKS